MNRDGSHNVPVRYIGHATYPIFFRDNRFTALKSSYGSQSNAWMGSNQFEKWITWWYRKVRRLKNDDVLLIMGNCDGHEREVNLPGLRIELLPRVLHQSIRHLM